MSTITININQLKPPIKRQTKVSVTKRDAECYVQCDVYIKLYNAIYCLWTCTSVVKYKNRDRKTIQPTSRQL